MNDLFEAARTAFHRAYAPYSGFAVGVALRTASGRIVIGANVENAAYPLGNCAEASAIASMIAAGERRIAECLIVASGERLCTPCGGCRQRLAEFATPDLPVHVCSPERHRRTWTLGELLPHRFSLDQCTVNPPEPATGGDPALLPHDRIADIIRRRAPAITPRFGLILGSGLGGLADMIERAVTIPYGMLPGFPRPGVEGHGGRLVLGTLEDVPVACLQGRTHLYEGGPDAAIKLPVRVLKALGCEVLIVTNAAGSLRAEIGPGSLVLIEDHINMLGHNPLTGPNQPEVGPRFPDMSEAYSRTWRQRVQAAAARQNVEIAGGVYLATLGPCFETPAEIRAFRALGADLVGMSTVPEVIVARHVGLEVIGLSIVTNFAAGMAEGALSHDETLAEAGAAGEKLERLLRGLFKELPPDDR